MHYKTAIIISIVLSSTILSISQDNVATRNSFLDAEYYFYNGQYTEALPLYLSALKFSKNNANINYKIGLCYIKSENNKISATPYFEEAVKNVSIDYNEGSFKETAAPVEAHFYLGKAYMINNQLDEAIKKFNEFKGYLTVEDVIYIDFVDQQIKACRNAKTLYSTPINVSSTPLGKTINTAASNFNPVVSTDESTLVYTSISNTNPGIYFSKKVKGEWTKPQNISQELKIDKNCRSVSLSSDGTELYIINEDNANGSIYVAHYINNSWTSMKKLNKNINTKSWETHACVTSDGKTLYFTSNRKGSYGGLDIYQSTRESREGDWGPEKNLGPTINSPYNEDTPFISENGKSLYFSSQGHFNIGGFDVFVASNANEVWSVPINMGYPINTTDDDLFFSPVQNGEYAYTAAINNKEYGKKNIVRMSFPDNTLLAQNDQEESPTVNMSSGRNTGRMIEVKGVLTLQNNLNEFGDDFKITITDPEGSKTIAELKPEEGTGYFSYRLSPGTYTFTFEGKDYEGQAKQLLIPRNFPRKEIQINTELVPNEVVAGSFFSIKSIFYEQGSPLLSEEAKIELERLNALMTNNPSLQIKLTAHADNKKLSEERANSVIKYLASKGIDETRFITEQEQASHGHSSGENLNRVDLKVLKTEQDIFVIYERPTLVRSISGKKEEPVFVNKGMGIKYTLQLMAVATPVDESYFNEIQNIKISRGDDNYYRYTYGIYSSYEEAKAAKEKLAAYGNKYKNIFIKDVRSIPNY